MKNDVRRVLGLTFDERPIYEPNNWASSLTFAATGGGKTVGVAVPTVQAMLADKTRSLILNDIKSGEIADQIGGMCIKYGRKFCVIDDHNELGNDYPHRRSINPFSVITCAFERQDTDLPYLIETMTHTFIPEVGGDERNKYWREEPREFLNLGTRILLRYNKALATPGGLYSLLADPDIWNSALEITADEAEGATRFMAKHTLQMREKNPEHYAQHIRSAISALKIYSEAPLHEAGRAIDITHEQILGGNWIVCFVNPNRHIDRLGSHVAQHFNSFMDVQLTGKVGKTDFVIDEYCSGPFEPAIRKLTTLRAFGGRLHLIAQSRQDSVKRYTEPVTEILQENCQVHVFLKFGNYKEAEIISRAMGEQRTISAGLGMNSDKTDFSININTGRERLFTADELMRMPDNEQIIHIAGIGFIHCLKIRQNQIAPTCFDLAPNRLEGGVLPPDPKVTLPTSKREI